MSRALGSRWTRSFEHDTGRNSPFGLPGGVRAVRRGGDLYARLMRVTVRHDYYNASQRACPDFFYSPTGTSAALMQSLGLVFRPEGSGFSIFYSSSLVNRRRLLSYLRGRGRGEPPCREVWTHLSILMTPANPAFANFTDIPYDADPNRWNFYFSNRNAHRDEEDTVLLTSGRRAEGRELLPLVPLQPAVPVDQGTRAIEVREVGGEPVQCRPRCVPRRQGDGAVTPSAASCAEVTTCREQGDPGCDCVETLYLDFAVLPEGRYGVAEIPYAADAGDEREVPVLHTASAPQPLCFIDLFFTDPSGGDDPLFPVRGLCNQRCYSDSDTRCIETVEYELPFATRRTSWRYYVVPQNPGSAPWDLRIDSASGGEGFDGPTQVTLPNAAGGTVEAACFVSREPLPLYEVSPFHFRLRGRRRGQEGMQTLVERLAVPSIRQVVPDRRAVIPVSPGDRLYSDLYVYV